MKYCREKLSNQLISFVKKNSVSKNSNLAFVPFIAMKMHLSKWPMIWCSLPALVACLFLNSVFDNVNHSILINRLENWVGSRLALLLIGYFYQSPITIVIDVFLLTLGGSHQHQLFLPVVSPKGQFLAPLLFSITYWHWATYFKNTWWQCKSSSVPQLSVQC